MDPIRSTRPDTRFSYNLFGLSVDTNQALSGLRSASPAATPDIRIELGPLPIRLTAGADAEPWYVSPFRDEAQRPVVTACLADEGRRLDLRYPDGPAFLIDLAATEIHVEWPAPFTVTTVTPYLLGPILAFALRLRGVVSLHASAVAIQGRAAVFLGRSRSGKSTIAAWLASRGHPVLADDVVAIDTSGDRYSARPAFPWLRLQRSTVEALQGILQPMPPLTSVWNDDYLDLELDRHPSYRFQPAALPIGALHFIDREDQPIEGGRGDDRLPDAVVDLLAQVWAANVSDRRQREHEFATLAGLASAVPVRRLQWSGRLEDLPALADRVETAACAPFRP